jgi:DNA-binding NtrC family response regulator
MPENLPDLPDIGISLFRFSIDATAWNSKVQFLQETALRDSSETPAVTGMLFRQPEFSASEMEAVRRLVGHSIAAVERELICETLVRRGGNRTHAATILGISIRALRNKIRTYRSRGRGVPAPNLFFRPPADADSGI